MAKDYDDCVKVALQKKRSLMLLEIQDIAFCTDDKARVFKQKMEEEHPHLYVADGRNKSLVMAFDAANNNSEAKIRKCNKCHKDFTSEWAGNRSCKPCNYLMKESGDGRLQQQFIEYA